MPPDEKKYTLEEAKQELARQECTWRGHDFEIIGVWEHDGPDMIFCGRGCGKKWKVVEV